MSALFSVPTLTNGIEALHSVIGLLHCDSGDRDCLRLPPGLCCLHDAFFQKEDSIGLRIADAIKGDLRACPSRPVRSLVQTPGVPDPGGHGSTAPRLPTWGAVPRLGDEARLVAMSAPVSA